MNAALSRVPKLLQRQQSFHSLMKHLHLISPKKCGVGALGIPRINVWVVPLQSHSCLGLLLPCVMADSWSPTTFELTVVAKYWNCRPEHYYTLTYAAHCSTTSIVHKRGGTDTLTLSLVSSQCVVYNRWKEKNGS